MVDAQPIAVAIIDDHPVFRQGMAAVIEGEPSTHLVAAAPSVAELDELIEDREVDVLLLDLSLPTTPSGSDAVKHYNGRPVRVLIVSSHDDPPNVVSAIRAGAVGYLTKMASPDEIIHAIHNVNAGILALTPTLANFFIDADRTAPTRLTPRELDVLERVTEGDKDKEIAERLYISIKTVQNHLASIRDKLGVDNRAKLVRIAIDQGLLGRT
jgi:DNA-binding NarL/FixJ family response regulator